MSTKDFTWTETEGTIDINITKSMRMQLLENKCIIFGNGKEYYELDVSKLPNIDI